jgi:hypothetical protein
VTKTTLTGDYIFPLVTKTTLTCDSIFPFVTKLASSDVYCTKNFDKKEHTLFLMWMQNTFINCFELILTMNKLQYNFKQNESEKEMKLVNSYSKVKENLKQNNTAQINLKQRCIAWQLIGKQEMLRRRSN